MGKKMSTRPSRSVVKVKCKIDIRNDGILLIFVVELLQNTKLDNLSVCVQICLSKIHKHIPKYCHD